MTFSPTSVFSFPSFLLSSHTSQLPHIQNRFSGIPGQQQIIFAGETVSAPDDSLTLAQRKQKVADYGTRAFAQMMKIEEGSEAQRNLHFLSLQPFMSAAGFFSAGLLAARLDPHEKFTVEFSNMVGKGGVAERLTGKSSQVYQAWEIAAGRLEHDTPASGGIVNFRFMHIETQDRKRIKELGILGERLRKDWQTDVMRLFQAGNQRVVRRSGAADVAAIRAILSSLQASPDRLQGLSKKARQALVRTATRNGQVIIPNLYGYPFSGYAFIPYKPYRGDYQVRPNQGVMINLRRASVSEIDGDADFVRWAQCNRNDLLLSFNARDRQGGMDAHWPKAGKVLDDLIAERNVMLEGYNNFFSDRAIPIREVFNYARARGSDYQLKYGHLGHGSGSIASLYSALNKNNLVWDDQTSVFGEMQQRWKAASEFWDNTFGFLPVIGNVGGIVFGAHNGLFGMMATDRIGGNAGAIIAGLQLAAETATGSEGAVAGTFEWQSTLTRGELRFTESSQHIPIDNPLPSSAARARGVNKKPEAPNSDHASVDGEMHLSPGEHENSKLDMSHPLFLGVSEKYVPDSTVIKSPFAAVINDRWSALVFDPERHCWAELKTGDFLAFNAETQQMEKTSIPAPATAKQRTLSAELFKISHWPEMPEVSGVAAEPAARVLPDNIEQVWVGSVDKLLDQRSTINANARMATSQGFSFNLHVLPEDIALDSLQNAKSQLPACNIIDMRTSAEFQQFRQSKYYPLFKRLTRGKEANRAAAVDIYRFWLLRKKGGYYLDLDDRLKPAFFSSDRRVAPNNLLPSSIVSMDMLSMDGSINSNFFGSHAGNPRLEEILQTGYRYWQEHPDMYQNRPRLLKGMPRTAEMRQAMKTYMSNVSRTWGPATLSEVFFGRNPDYLHFKNSLNDIFALSQRGVVSAQWIAWIRRYDNALFGPSNQIQMGSMHSWEHSR